MVDLGVKVRCLQAKCKLSTMQAECVADLVKQETGKKSDLRKADRVMTEQSGVKKEVLHGCVGQGCQHVYGPHDKRRACPKCNHPRYNADGVANEAVYYFPIRSRLEALMKCPNYVKLMQVQ